MLLNIQSGTALLEQEIAQLREQMGRCSAQMSSLRAFGLPGMEGAAVSAVAQKVRLQSAVANAHLLYAQSLLLADRQHLALLAALPTTSPGVLDTSVAQERLDEATRRREDLMWRKEEAARLRNAFGTSDEALFLVPARRVEDAPFDALIALQEQEIARQERILEQARDYARRTAQLYAAVDVGVLRASTSSAATFVRGGGWGNTGWIERAAFQRSVQARGSLDCSSGQGTLAHRFACGELVSQGAAWLLSAEGACGFAGFFASVDALGYEASLTPYGKGNRDMDDDSTSIALGAESSLGIHAGHGSATAWLGPAQAKHDTYVGSGTAGAALGLSLLDGDEVSPSLVAKAEVRGSAASSQTKGRVGHSDFNYHAKAKGEALAANAQAGVTLSSRGIEAKIGAEAYAATGEVLGGVTFLGVTVETALSAKVAGAGAKVGVEAGPTAVEGEVGLGLGLGLGAKIKVDWGGAWSALGRTANTIDAWWNSLFGVEERRYV